MRIVVPVTTNTRRKRFSSIGGVLFISSGVAAVMLLASVRARAYCPQNTRCTDPVDVGVETAASPSGITRCDSVNGSPLNFGSLPKGTTNYVRMRACVCPTDAYANPSWFGGNVVDATGIEFLNVGLGGNNTDFTIVGSGCVKYGTLLQSSANDGTGTHGANFTYDSGSGFASCPGNPPSYCYADIKFQPKQYGDPLAASLNFGVDCPGVAAGTSTNCLVAYTESVINYVTDGIKLYGTGSGFAILQPPTPTAGATPYPLSVPTSKTDPGEVNVLFQAQADSTTTTKWYAPLRYQATGREHVFSEKPVLQFSSTGEAIKTQTFTGQGGFLNAHALAGSASECVEVPITGWATNYIQPGGCPTPGGAALYISQALNDQYFANGLGDRPALFEQLAYTESTYQQFVNETLKPPPEVIKCHISAPNALWPYENAPDLTARPPVKQGHFVGLMQVPNGEDVAFDWLSNIARGADIFKDKIRLARKYSRNRVAEDTPKGMPQLMADQLEDVALGVFKGFTRPAWYWVPKCSTNGTLTKGNCSGGTWSWVVNPDNPCRHGGTNCNDKDNVVVQVNKVLDTTPPCQQ